MATRRKPIGGPSRAGPPIAYAISASLRTRPIGQLEIRSVSLSANRTWQRRGDHRTGHGEEPTISAIVEPVVTNMNRLTPDEIDDLVRHPEPADGKTPADSPPAHVGPNGVTCRFAGRREGRIPRGAGRVSTRTASRAASSPGRGHRQLGAPKTRNGPAVPSVAGKIVGIDCDVRDKMGRKKILAEAPALFFGQDSRCASAPRRKFLLMCSHGKNRSPKLS
jgi:hypothetical protein